MSEAQTAASMDGGGAIKLSEADLGKEETQEAAVEGEWSYHRGYAFDVGAEETASPSSAARAKRIRAEIGDEPLTGIESRPFGSSILITMAIMANSQQKQISTAALKTMSKARLIAQ